MTVELLTGAYDAGGADDRDGAEWPPHPARLYCALVAAARTEQERAALGWLERQAPPAVWAPERIASPRRFAYVVTNAIADKPGSQSHPGRTNGMRTRAHSVLAAPRIRVVWEQAQPEPGQLAALDDVARRVPYVGRSTGVALVSASAVETPAPDGTLADAAWAVHEPCDLDDAETTLRVPYAGYLAELDELHRTGRPAWEASRLRGYRLRRPLSPTPEPPLPPSVYQDVVVLRLTSFRPDGRLAGRFTDALRSLVLRRAGRDSPAVLHGHGADGRPHVAFLALPDVGFPNSDGHLLGLAVAIPELPDEERRAVLTAVLGPGPDPGVQLAVPGIGTVQLDHQPGLVRPWGASVERWRHGSRRWVSTTPVVLDRYPKSENQVAGLIVGSCRTVGLPDPVDVQVSKEPLTPGAVRMQPGDLPRQVRGRLYRHVALTFEQTVPGPVLLGAGRYLGVGLLAPVAGAGA